jgi:serine/threonine protein kinase
VVLKTRFEVPDHQLYRLIGEGAYGQVWLARNAIGTFHAVKIVQRSSFTEERPYEREFHGLQRFTPLSRQHPGLVQILHVGRNDTAGFMYYIMEIGDDEQHGQQIDPDHYVPRNLSRDLARRGYLSVAETVNLAIPLAEALGFLHKNGLIHRDIKPSNIIFVKDHPKLADIGLVTEMAGGGREITFVGTVGYSAPEGPGSAAGDIFSLGKLLYVACTGCPVTQFPDLPSSHSQRPDAEDLLELNRMILKACEPVVQRRYASTQSLVADLRRLQAALLPTTTDTLPGGGS